MLPRRPTICTQERQRLCELHDGVNIRQAVSAAGAFLALWVLCGFVAVGFKNAADLHDHCGQLFTSAFREIDHSRLALIQLGGPFTLLGALAYSSFGQTGWTLRRDCEVRL